MGGVRKKRQISNILREFKREKLIKEREGENACCFIILIRVFFIYCKMYLLQSELLDRDVFIGIFGHHFTHRHLEIFLRHVHSPLSQRKRTLLLLSDEKMGRSDRRQGMPWSVSGDDVTAVLVVDQSDRKA